MSQPEPGWFARQFEPAPTFESLMAAIVEHHAQKADDRCIEDDDRLYSAAGLPSCDRRVGDKAAMLKNCERFIERRCERGGWPTYAELEAENAGLRRELARHPDRDAICGAPLSEAERPAAPNTMAEELGGCHV